MNEIETAAGRNDALASAHSFATATAEECHEQREDLQLLMDDVGDAVIQYCQRRPGVAALTLFAVGFFVGWKIKPW